MRLLCLDVGTKTLGAAVSDETETVATPVRTLPRRGGKEDLRAVTALYEEVGAGAVVLGLPLDLQGKEGEAARRVRALGEKLKGALSCPIHYWDERFSTVAAERVLLEGGVRRKKRRAVIDHLAATVILQSYLDRAGSRPGDREDTV